MVEKEKNDYSSNPSGMVKYRARHKLGGGIDGRFRKIASLFNGIVSLIFREGRFKDLLEKLSNLKLAEFKNVTINPTIRILSPIVTISINKTGTDSAEFKEYLDNIGRKIDELNDRIDAINDKGGTLYIGSISLNRSILPEHAMILEQARSGSTFPEQSVLKPEKELLYNRIRPGIRLITSNDTAWKVISISKSDTLTIGQISSIVEKDPAIAGRVIQYAGSAYCGSREKIESLHDAIVYTGLGPLMRIALQVALMSRKMPKCEGFDYEAFWSESSAAAARRISKIFTNKISPENCLTAGLLHRIGELAYASTFSAEYGDYLLRRKEGSEKTMMELYPEKLPLAETELTARLLQEWKLPEYMSLAVLHFQNNERLSDAPEVAALTQILQWSSRIARLMNNPLSRRLMDVEPVIEDLFTRLMVGEKQFGDVFNDIINEWRLFGNIFGIRTKAVPPWPDIIEGATS